MTDKMMEGFENCSLHDGYGDDRRLEENMTWFMAGWEAAQAEQSVPVVGDVVAWLNECQLNLSHPVMPHVSLNEPAPDRDWRITPLYKAPTHSIITAELERLRRIEAVMIKVSNLRFDYVTLPIIREMIDAAIAGEKNL